MDEVLRLQNRKENQAYAHVQWALPFPIRFPYKEPHADARWMRLGRVSILFTQPLITAGFQTINRHAQSHVSFSLQTFSICGKTNDVSSQ